MTNHELQEVLCGFYFDPSSNHWDSTYFGKYYSLIESLGFTVKEEQKGFQVRVENDKQNILSSQVNELEPRMVFKNPEKQFATLLFNNFISFHKLPPYNCWEAMLEEQIIPGLTKYKEIGLGNNLRQINMLYLNRFEFPIEHSISDYFNIIPSLNKIGIEGAEKSLVFQEQYEIKANFMLNIKFTGTISLKNTKEVFLECSCVATDIKKTDDWKAVAEEVHHYNNKVFNNLLKKEKNESIFVK